INVIEHAEIPADSGAELACKARVEVELMARIVRAEIHVARPSADVPAVLVRPVDADLYGEILIGLADAAEIIVGYELRIGRELRLRGARSAQHAERGQDRQISHGSPSWRKRARPLRRESLTHRALTFNVKSSGEVEGENALGVPRQEQRAPSQFSRRRCKSANCFSDRR